MQNCKREPEVQRLLSAVLLMVEQADTHTVTEAPVAPVEAPAMATEIPHQKQVLAAAMAVPVQAISQELGRELPRESLAKKPVICIPEAAQDTGEPEETAAAAIQAMTANLILVVAEAEAVLEVSDMAVAASLSSASIRRRQHEIRNRN